MALHSQFCSVQVKPYSRFSKQQGFTLIELMVVVVIVAVVVSVGVLSLGRVNSDIGMVQKTKIESFLKQVSDEAAFKQRLLLLSPTEKGLELYQKSNFKWQRYSELETLPWHESFEVDWQLNDVLAQQQNLPAKGWLFWPSGDVSEGTIELSNTAETEVNEIVIQWNSLLQFDDDN